MTAPARVEELKVIAEAASAELAEATAQEALEWTARTFGERLEVCTHSTVTRSPIIFSWNTRAQARHSQVP